jgi:hypothetical protein
MSCKIVLHKPLDGKFAKCALINVVGRALKMLEIPQKFAFEAKYCSKRYHGC